MYGNHDYLPYLDRVTVTRNLGSAQDPATGVLGAPRTVAVLESPCDCQRSSRATYRTRHGDAHVQADAVLYLPSAVNLHEVETGDDVVVDTDMTVLQGRVVDVDHWNVSLLVNWT